MINCEICKYWIRNDKPGDEDIGYCHKYAPRPSRGDTKDKGEWAWWPETRDIDKCGEGRPEQDVNPKSLLLCEEIGWSVRVLNRIQGENIHFIGDLIERKPSELLRWPNFGKTSLREVEDTLWRLNLTLGVPDPLWADTDVAEARARHKDEIERMVRDLV